MRGHVDSGRLPAAGALESVADAEAFLLRAPLNEEGETLPELVHAHLDHPEIASLWQRISQEMDAADFAALTRHVADIAALVNRGADEGHRVRESDG